MDENTEWISSERTVFISPAEFQRLVEFATGNNEASLVVCLHPTPYKETLCCFFSPFIVTTPYIIVLLCQFLLLCDDVKQIQHVGWMFGGWCIVFTFNGPNKSLKNSAGNVILTPPVALPFLLVRSSSWQAFALTGKLSSGYNAHTICNINLKLRWSNTQQAPSHKAAETHTGMHKYS